MVSRIDSYTMPTIEAFIELCDKNKIEFHIAGNEFLSEKYTAELKNRLKDEVLIGNVDGINFLRQNVDKYLFVAGAGQVVLEAGILGYPVFLTSHFGFENSSFLTEENIRLFNGSNFTIRKNFLKNNKNMPIIQELDTNNLEKYNIHDYLSETRDIKRLFDLYHDFLAKEERVEVV
jgi:hypothetical protein